MARKRTRPSKARIIDRLVTMLKVDDYTKLEGIVQQILSMQSMPVNAVTVAWKPLIPGSLNFTVMGFDGNDPIKLQDAAQALRIVANDLTHRALGLALQDQPVNGGAVDEETEDGGD